MKTVGRSCYDLSFYRLVRHRPARNAFRYLAAIAALYAAVLFVPALPRALGAVGEARTLIVARVPDGAAFSVEGGVFSMSPGEPLVLGDRPRVILDPAFHGEPDPERPYRDTDLVVGRDAVFVPRARGSWSPTSLKDIPDIRTTKEELVASIDRYGRWSVVGLFAFAAVAFFLAFIVSRAAYAAFFAALGGVLGALSGVRIAYSRWWATCLHAATAPMIAEYVFGAFGISMPYALPVMTLLFVAAVIADERANPSGSSDAAAVPPSPPDRGEKPRKRSDR